MSESKISGAEIVLMGALAVVLCFAPLVRRASREAADLARRHAPASSLAWPEEPLTAAGVMLAQRDVAAWRAPAPGSQQTTRATTEQVLSHIASGQAIRFFNRTRPRFRIFLVFSLLGLALLGGACRSDVLREELRNGQWLVGLVLAVGGGGLVASLPAGTPRLLQAPILTLGALQALGGLLAFLEAVFRKTDPRKLKYGPAFALPRTALGKVTRPAEGIVLGRADRRVLPEHTSWNAAAGGKIVVPFDRLSCGVSILGEKGSGKSRLLFAIHDAIRATYPEVPILIHDPKGEWYRTYFDPATDLYFAPHFRGSAAWSLWDDFELAPELRNALIASAINSHPDPSGSFWMDQALALLDAAIGNEGIDSAVRFLSAYPREHKDDKFLLSVYGTARLGFMDLAKVELTAKALSAAGTATRSIDDFLGWRGRIFLLNDPACASQQQGTFGLFLAAFLLRALSMPDVPAGTLRAVAIIDEALTFHLPPEVDQQIYTLCRSKGICIIAGAQRLPLSRYHERAEWETAEFTVAMKVINQESQRSLSQRAGNVLLRETKTSTSIGRGGASRTAGEHDSRLDAIPPEHFGRLAPREFILFHDRGLVTGRTVDVDRPQRAITFPRFDPRDDVRKLSLKLLGDE